jgi:DNA-binding transcriptional LysR family regulator
VGASQNLEARFCLDLLSLIVKPQLALSQSITITFDSTDKLIEGFKKNNFDLLIGAFSSKEQTGKNWVSQKFSLPIKLFIPKNFFENIEEKEKQLIQTSLGKIIQLANEKKISLALPAYPSALRTDIEQFLLNSSVLPVSTVECNNFSAIVQLVEQGFAMSFAPAPSLIHVSSSSALAIISPPGGYWSHEISVFIQNGNTLHDKNFNFG